MAEKKCSSYLNDTLCTNVIDNDKKWCTDCSLILVKKQVKCKSLEKKYYSESFDIPDKSLSELLKIYSKLKEVIEVRRFVYYQGFHPEIRDTSHSIRIENVKRYRKLIKERMKELHLREPEIKMDETDEIDSDSEEDTAQLMETIKPKENRKEKNTEEINEEELIMCKFMKIPYFILSSIALDFREKIDEYLIPRLGENFVTAFGLQYVLYANFYGRY
jgi:hypothetical protein